jgi:hypothetical protein
MNQLNHPGYYGPSLQEERDAAYEDYLHYHYEFNVEQDLTVDPAEYNTFSAVIRRYRDKAIVLAYDGEATHEDAAKLEAKCWDKLAWLVRGES